MSKAYDDIEAVTRLLEEKEKDLELTVQIGKELLAQNNRLENRVNQLEINIKTTTDNLHQIQHELHQKNNLISILTNDDADNLIKDNDDDGSDNVGGNELSSGIFMKPQKFNLDLLQQKISSLQNENVKLRKDTMQLVKETEECEEKEKKLMDDITNQLNSTNSQFDGISKF